MHRSYCTNDRLCRADCSFQVPGNTINLDFTFHVEYAHESWVGCTKRHLEVAECAEKDNAICIDYVCVYHSNKTPNICDPKKQMQRMNMHVPSPRKHPSVLITKKFSPLSRLPEKM